MLEIYWWRKKPISNGAAWVGRFCPVLPNGHFVPNSAIFDVPNSSGLTFEVTKVEEPSTTDQSSRHELDLFNSGGVQYECSFDANREADLADGEGAAGACTMLLDHSASEHLHAELITLHDLVMNRHRVAHAKIRVVRAELGFFEGVNDGRDGGHGKTRESFKKPTEARIACRLERLPIGSPLSAASPKGAALCPRRLSRQPDEYDTDGQCQKALEIHGILALRVGIRNRACLRSRKLP